jgi:hypothetical protein
MKIHVNAVHKGFQGYNLKTGYFSSQKTYLFSAGMKSLLGSNTLLPNLRQHTAVITK